MKNFTFKNYLAPPLPINSDKKTINLIKLNPNFWGVGGRGVRGKPLTGIAREKAHISKMAVRIPLEKSVLLLTPHPPLLVNSGQA